MQKNRVTIEDVGLHSKKSFIHQSMSGEDANSPVSSPSFSSLSPYLLLLTNRATELCLATTLTWSDGMNGGVYKWRLTPLFIALQGRLLQGVVINVK